MVINAQHMKAVLGKETRNIDYRMGSRFLQHGLLTAILFPSKSSENWWSTDKPNRRPGPGTEPLAEKCRTTIILFRTVAQIKGKSTRHSQLHYFGSEKASHLEKRRFNYLLHLLVSDGQVIFENT